MVATLKSENREFKVMMMSWRLNSNFELANLHLLENELR